jgi:hypothetical protein
MAAAITTPADPPYSAPQSGSVMVKGPPPQSRKPAGCFGGAAIGPFPLLAVGSVFLAGSVVVGNPGQAALVSAGEAPAPQWRTVPLPAGASDPPVSRWRGIPQPQQEGPRSRLIPVASPAPSGTSPSGTSPSGPASVRLPADAQAVASERPPFPYLLSPSLGGGLPTGYVGGWGDYYIAGSAATPGKTRDGVVDGSLNMGFSLGNPERLIGLDLNWGIGSIKNFNSNGSVAVAAGRILVNRPDLQVAVAGGLLDAYVYGDEPGQPQVNGYGAITAAVPLRPGDPRFPQRLQVSVGGGGNSFSAIDGNFQSTETGFFAAVGVEVLPNLGVSLGQSSRSTNLNLSWIPLRRLPVFVNLVAADLFDVTPFGTVGVLSVGWGDSLRRGFFSE